MNLYYASIIIALLLLGYALYQVYVYSKPVELGTEHIKPLCNNGGCKVIPLQLLFQSWKPRILRVNVSGVLEEAKSGTNVYRYGNETYILILDDDNKYVTDSTLSEVLDVEVGEDAFYTIINYTVMPLIAGFFWLIVAFTLVKNRRVRRI